VRKSSHLNLVPVWHDHRLSSGPMRGPQLVMADSMSFPSQQQIMPLSNRHIYIYLFVVRYHTQGMHEPKNLY